MKSGYLLTDAAKTDHDIRSGRWHRRDQRRIVAQTL
jgi:hypothetical protein